MPEVEKMCGKLLCLQHALSMTVKQSAKSFAHVLIEIKSCPAGINILGFGNIKNWHDSMML